MYLRLLLAAVVLMVGFGCSTDQAQRNMYSELSRAPVTSEAVNRSGPSVDDPLSYGEFAYQMKKAQEKPVEKSNQSGCYCGFF